jgi:hypothetical protein
MLRKIIRGFVILPFVALVAVPAYAARTAPMYTPDPIEVPAGKNTAQVMGAIKKACFDKGWETREVGPGHIQAKHTKSGKKGDYTAVVDIRYDSKTVRIAYKDSENLNYDAASKSIHKTYNSWVHYLERNIRSDLGAY